MRKQKPIPQQQQERFAAMLVTGAKTIELRRYALPDDFVGRPILLLATPDGSEGVSTLPQDLVPANHPGVSVAGTVVFSRQIKYTSLEAFAADEHAHRVPPGPPYGWVPAVTQALWGWVVERAEPVAAIKAAVAEATVATNQRQQQQQQPKFPLQQPMQRVLSSLFTSV
jgi:hypothetical protein